MNAKHTPGPWEHTNDVAEERFADIESTNGNLYIRATWGASGRSKAGGKKQLQLEMEANAHLISAAPDLLEALQDVRSEVRQYAEGFELLWAKVDAAIRKATGEQA